MANLNNANVIFSIDTKSNVSVRVSCRPVMKGKEPVINVWETKAVTNDDKASTIALIAYTIKQLLEENIPSAMIIVPTDVAVRCLEIRSKILKQPGASPDEIKAEVIKSWMKKQQLTEMIDAISDLVDVFYTMINTPGVDYGIMKRHTLTMWELNQKTCQENGINDGDELSFHDGVDEEFGIESADTKYLNGTFKVTTRSYTNIETGEITHRYYVERSGNSIRLNNAKLLVSVMNDRLPQEQDLSEAQIVTGTAF